MYPARKTWSTASSTLADNGNATMLDSESPPTPSLRDMEHISSGIVRLVVRMQEHYAFEQNDLAAKCEETTEQQQESQAQIRTMAAELHKLRTETTELKERFDRQLEVFQQINLFMSQVSEGKFRLAQPEQLRGQDRQPLSNSPPGRPRVSIDVEQLSGPPRGFPRCVRNSFLEHLPPTPTTSRTTRSVGTKALKRRIHKLPAAPVEIATMDNEE